MTLDTTQLAKLLDLNPRTVTRFATDGILVRARDEEGNELQGRWEMVRNTHLYIAYLKKQARWDDTSETKKALLHNRRLGAEAEMSELRLAQFKGKLHRREDVAFYVTGMLTRFKARCQAIAARVSHSLVGETNERKIRKKIGEEVELALRELAVPDENSFAKANEDYLESQGASMSILAELNGSDDHEADEDEDSIQADTETEADR